MNPSTTQTSMQVYAASQEQYKNPPNAAQMDVGVAPLDTLPASWWNWLWEQITKNNNAVYQGIADIRTELLNVLSDANITPSALDATQLLQAINVIRKRVPTTDPVSHDPIPGAVISSAARSGVSVDSNTGAMTVNALSDWTSQDSVKDVIDAWETEQEQDLQDGLTAIENTITARAHVLCLEVEETTGQYTNTTYSLNALSRVDGRPLSSYTPEEGDVLLLHFPAASLYQTRTHTGGTLTVGQYSFTWTLTADFEDYVLLVLTGTTACNICFGVHKSTEADILNIVYPVGSIYWTSKAPDNGGNPNVLFGGTWVQIKDRFVLAAGDTYGNGSTGGSATVSLTESNLPAHTHTMNHRHSGSVSGSVGLTDTNHTHDFSGTTGGMTAHVNHSHTIPVYHYDYNQATDGVAGRGATYWGECAASSTNIEHGHEFSGTTGGMKANVSHSHSWSGGVTIDTIIADTGSVGSGTAHENMPPYIVKYCWERTA